MSADKKNPETPSTVVVRKKTGETDIASTDDAANPDTIVAQPALSPIPKVAAEPASSTEAPAAEAEAAPEAPAAEAVTAAPEAPAVEATPEPEPVAPKQAPESEPKSSPAHAAAPVLEDKDEELDFAAMLGNTATEQVEQGMIITGSLVAVSGEWAFVDLGGKTEGLLAVSEIKDKEGNLTVGIGEAVEAFVVSTRGGEVKLSKSLSQSIRDYESLRDVYEGRLPVDGRVVGTNKGGYEVMVAGRRAFCPVSQMDTAFTEDPEVHVGKTYSFRITQMDGKGKRVVLSRAAILREEQQRRREELRDQLEVGAILNGEVKSVQDYGAFVDIGGIEGLCHVSELSWRRVEHPSEIVSVGDHVEVKVLGIKKTEKGDRISLSLRASQPHPWVAVGTKFVVGETYDGKVTRLQPFGAFVEIGPGIEGLVHVSEMSWEKRINHPSELLEEGQEIRVYLKSIDEERQRIGLSIKALASDPWSDAAERYGVGIAVKGTVEKIESFGIFLQIEGGITALIPGSETGVEGGDMRRKFKPGQELSGTVLSIDPSARRMSVSLKSAAEAQNMAEVREYMKGQKAADGGGKKGFGTLGDLFADRLKK